MNQMMICCKISGSMMYILLRLHMFASLIHPIAVDADCC